MTSNVNQNSRGGMLCNPDVLNAVRQSVRLESSDAGSILGGRLTIAFDVEGVLFCAVRPGAKSVSSIKLCWEVPATGVKGVWTSQALHEKRLRADWEEADCTSRASVEAPVLSVFGHHDENIITFASSDAVHTTELRAPVREEDDLLHCSVSLFLEPSSDHQSPVTVRIDVRNCRFGESLNDIAKWWQNDIGYKPMQVPLAAKLPVYSTWYAFHQDLDTQELLEECRLAKPLGCDTIIVDDGWQTMDSNRGYDFTGDWEPIRMSNMKAFTDEVHLLGMKAMLWYSVPFVGIKSKAFNIFKDKLLTVDHRWAPVFDPRYPEVREYLIGKYEQAVGEWGYDGLKLDFIDDFREYEATPKGRANGRDFASVNEAVEELLCNIRTRLEAINPDVLIEFRQRYCGPVVRQNANMLRAFDCPADSVTNRIRTTDLRLLGRGTAIHSDMLTWHPSSSYEVAALQLNAILFSVPQISVRLKDSSPEVREMIGFYLNYYRSNIGILLDAKIVARGPLENYSQLEVSSGNKRIVGSYSMSPIHTNDQHDQLDVINGTLNDSVILELGSSTSFVSIRTFDARGRVALFEETKSFSKGFHTFEVPAGGILSIRFR